MYQLPDLVFVTMDKHWFAEGRGEAERAGVAEGAGGKGGLALPEVADEVPCAASHEEARADGPGENGKSHTASQSADSQVSTHSVRFFSTSSFLTFAVRHG